MAFAGKILISQTRNANFYFETMKNGKPQLNSLFNTKRKTVKNPMLIDI
jgi:hypothetical protein